MSDGGWLWRVLEWPPLRHLGKISYGVYVHHIFVLSLTARLLRPTGIVLQQAGSAGMLLACGGTLGLAALSWRWFEAPLNALKDRFSPSPLRS